MLTTSSTAGPGRFDRSAHPVTPEPTGDGGCVLTIGVFDGFHLGHQQLVARTVLEAGRKHVPAVLMTFDPHPLTVVDCARAPRQLTTVDQRAEYARAAGIDEVIVMPFTPTLASTTAEEFAIEVLVDRFRVRSIVVGQNFRFGRDNIGDVTLLEDIGTPSPSRCWRYPAAPARRHRYVRHSRPVTWTSFDSCSDELTAPCKQQLSRPGRQPGAPL
jgi:FAD synthase